MVEVADADLRGSLRRLFSRFLAPTSADAGEVARLEVVAPTVVRPEPATRTLPLVQRTPEGGLHLEGEDYSATLSVDGLRASVVGQGRFPVETVLKVMLAGALARRGGLLVHGVAVAHQERAALFVGHSGAGKSTLGALWAEAGGVVLSDELVAVWPEPTVGGAQGAVADGSGSGHAAGPGTSSALGPQPGARSPIGPGAAQAPVWRAAGTPWNVGVPREAVLKAVGTLAWDSGSRWESQPAGAVGRMLMLNALLPEATTAGRGGLLAAAGRLLSEVPPVRLVFARDASAAAVVRGALEAAGHG
ncbi:hypothetical protein [Pyxidicoccus trucidator]|uniref:hypothetical protein n=1 Tax=Pyxidicoccus trucidator TaxID=2709662 RepID=UPI001F086CC1|nr:hypothetical protein [Pyxidicoccus trucidator]